MSIATDVSRIKGNITAALAAIADKGVTVPDGSTSDALAALIASIEAGGGGVNVTHGTIIPEDMSAATLRIEHGLNALPDVVLIAAANNTNNVYNSSSPNGQSFIYAIKYENPILYNPCYVLYRNEEKVGYASGPIESTIGTHANYYIAMSETEIIWANRNSTYGFGYSVAPFIWIALKENAE